MELHCLQSSEVAEQKMADLPEDRVEPAQQGAKGLIIEGTAMFS